MSVQPESIAPAGLQSRSHAGNGAVHQSRERLAPHVVLLFTRDRAFDTLVAEALLGSSAIVLITRNVSDALQVVCARGRELRLAVLDFDHDCGGMTLLSAMHTCYGELPIVIAAADAEDRFRTLAFANGARAWLSKPVQVASLSNTIAGFTAAHERAH